MKDPLAMSIMTLLLLITLGSCKADAQKGKSTVADSTANTTNKTTEMKYYELVFIWVNDPVMFQEYGQKVTPIVAKYGGALDKMFEPKSIYAEGIDQPHIINLVHYDSKEALEAFEHDADFMQIKHLRDKSIRMMSFRGYLNVDNPTFNDLENRVYNIELANYKGGNDAAYTKYEQEGESAMRAYGYDVEFKLAIDAQFGHDGPQPDFAKISFFQNASGMTDFEGDPKHKLIEEELYPNAVENMIWISGSIHAMMLQMMNAKP